MREYPWHQRRASLKHHRWFRNLLDLHALTQAWVKEADAQPAKNRPFAGELAPLEAHDSNDGKEVRLEQLLDDTHPEDLLQRLETAVLGAQAWQLSTLLRRAGASEEDTLKSKLEQTSWNLGKQVAQSRWKDLPESSRSDLRAIFLTLSDSPIARALGEEAFLLKRGLNHSLEFEFRLCAHEMNFPESSDLDSLCALHSAWVRGYLYGMNHRASLEYTPRAKANGRCSHHWTLLTGASD